MKVNTSAPWHKESYDRFINERLPELIAARLPLASYEVDTLDTYTCRVKVTISTGNGDITIDYPNIPRPDDNGVFEIDGRRLVVVPIATSDDLEAADVLCVGEQLHNYVAERLGEAPPDLAWDESLARSWLPIDRWINSFLRVDGGDGGGAGQRLDETNWLSARVHLRRLFTPGRDRAIAPSHPGRVCLFEIPEGPNLGRVHTIANGAEIRDGKLRICEDGPENALGLGALMVPFLEHDDPTRSLMGINMMRQRQVPTESEPALVRTGNEPDAPDFWCGLNLLTAYVSWGIGSYEDAVTISESAARRFKFEHAIEPGDKVANRHGAKGVIGRILPDAEMPHLADGTPVELVYNMMGCFTRMNFGQMREAIMGRIAHAEKKPAIVPPFHAPNADEIRARLTAAGLPEDGMETLNAGRKGKPLARRSAVGYVYWARLTQDVRGKIHASATTSGRLNLQGHLEYCALRDAGAFETIIETFNTRSVLHERAATLADRVAGGYVEQAAAPTPAFADVVRRLNALGVGVEIKGESLMFRLSPPSGPTLKLACPVPHPWLPERELTEVGVMQDCFGWAALIEANTRFDRFAASKSPESLTKKAEEQLGATVKDFAENLIRNQNLQFSATIPSMFPSAAGQSMVEPRYQRVLFSGRSVITPGEGLRFDQVGLPDEIAWELFGPLVVRETGKKDEVAARSENAARVLDEVMARSWVIINRAPTLMSTNLLAFHPVRRTGRTIQLHPMACMPLNADHDGDQVAVFLPITEAGQREAGERLSIAGHIRRDPDLLSLFAPTQDFLWGLAWLSTKPKGLAEIAELAGVDVAAPEGCITRDSLIAAMYRLLNRDGVDVVVAALDRLMLRGFEVIKETGASFSPFFGESVERPAEPHSDDPEAWDVYAEDLINRIAARTDFDSADLGPQLLAAKCGARGSLSYLAGLIGSRGVVRDAAGQIVVLRHGFVDGVSPDELFARAVGARKGLIRSLENVTEAIRSRSWSHDLPSAMQAAYRLPPTPSTKGFGVLSRAMRSERPGLVFARAAAAGETDPLTNTHSRLFVGLLPLDT